VDKQAIERSCGALGTKIHTTVNVLGNPIGFHLRPGLRYDLEGADALMKDMPVQTVITDKAYGTRA
jgi:hypothetical protein